MAGFPHFKGDTVHTETIVLAAIGVAQQFPSFVIDPAFAVTYEVEAVPSTGIIWFAATKAAAESGTDRKRLGIGSSITLKMKNVQDIWFVSSVALDEIGLVVEEIT